MDVNELRTVVTVLSFLAFAGIWAWAWSRQRSEAFAAAAQLPFSDGEADGQPLAPEGRHE